MNREHLVFLLAGLAFGMLFGFGLYHAVDTSPELDAEAVGSGAVDGPRGPQAPTQVGPNADGGAPMVAEVNRLKRLLQENPEDGAVLVRLANLYHDAGMWDRAVGYYERARAMSPEDPDLLTDLGVCYRGLGQFDQALAMFAEANRVQPTHWQSLFNTVVVAAFDVGRFELAQQAIDSMEAIEPKPEGLDAARLDELRQAVEQARTVLEKQS